MEIKVSINDVEVYYCGDEQFAEESLCSLISEIKDIIQEESAQSSHSRKLDKEEKNEEVSLHAFLQEMEEQSRENRFAYRKFLIAAVWLNLKGKSSLATSDVSAALEKNQISALRNPSDSLKKNIRHGYCQRNGNSFFVTQEGFRTLKIDFPCR